MENALNLCFRNQYYGHTNPGIYIGDREDVLLLWSQPSMGGRYQNEFDSIVFMDGTYYLRYVFGDRTADGDTYYPIPFEQLDENNSLSFGEISRFCEEQEKTARKLTADVFGYISRQESNKHGFAPDQIRYWQEDDRIAFLQPFVKTKKKIFVSGYTVNYFE